MAKQLRPFVFQKTAATSLISGEKGKTWKMPHIAANKNGETPSQPHQPPKNTDSTSQHLLLATVFGKMFASPIFSSLRSVCAIVPKHLGMKTKPVSRGVTLHRQRSHGKDRLLQEHFLECMRVNFAMTKFKISTGNSNVYQEFGEQTYYKKRKKNY